MPSTDLTPEKGLHLFASKKYHYIILGLFLGLCLFYLLKSCTFNSFSEVTYRIGQDSRWHSLNLMGKERSFSAFNNELLTAIAKKEHVRFHIMVASNPMDELQQGNVQGILSALQPGYLNANLLFSEPYFLTGPVLIIPSTAPVEGWNEKRKKIVAILATDPHLLNLEQDPSLQVKLYSDILVALADLSERRIDGAIFPVIPAYTYTTTFYQHELKIVTLPLTSQGIRLVTLNNETGKILIKSFNEGLVLLKQEGIYSDLLKQWGLINVENIAAP